VKIPFSKLHGAGNDVVVVDCLHGDPVTDWSAFARFVLDRHTGIGGDQLLLLRPSERADFFMGIRNPDGSEAEMCANGIRAFYKHLYDRGYTQATEVAIDTLAGVVRPRRIGPETFEVEMTVPVLDPARVPTTLGTAGGPPVVGARLAVAGREVEVTTVSMGNPHCVVFVDDPDAYPVSEVGPAIERHAAFPRRTNVEFVGVRSRTELIQRTWERGTGETLACGSGACATLVAGVLSGRCDREVDIELRGGHLWVSWPAPDAPVRMRGPAIHVFDGELAYP
jgi:diaminopimelate epimerase